MTITIIASNANGIHAAKRKGIENWAGKHTPNVWCIQEIRAPQDDVGSIFDKFGFEYATAGRIEAPTNLHAMNEVCRVKGRTGVGLPTNLEVLTKRYDLPGLNEDMDSGRWVKTGAKAPKGYTVTVTSMYMYAGNTDDPTRMEQKYRFLDTMLKRIGALRDEAVYGGKQAILCGDFNVTHTPLGIKSAKANEKHTGFLPEERTYVDEWLDKCEFVDMTRSSAGDIQGPYTWWSQRGRTFDSNVGQRIDCQFVAPELTEAARGFVIDKAPTYDKRWFDHAPLTITYEV